MLRFLNEKESWDLLQSEVFGKPDECPEMLKSIGECIAQNCDGLPLAIVAVSSSLMAQTEGAEDLTEKWWEKVSENVTMYAADYSQHQHSVFNKIELSYAKLPQRLQNCFLYLGVFPEDHEIHVWTLTRLWIAEGLTLEETAERDLHGLIDMNLVMPGKISYPNGQIKTCRLHKLIHGFCKYKAAQQDFYQEIRMSGDTTSDDTPISLPPNCRRLCIYSHHSEFLSRASNGWRVRSILYLDKDNTTLHPKYSSTIYKRFKLLRVLESKCLKFTKFPKKVTKMMHLRYISLSCDVIPESMSSLCFLETLVVDTQLPFLQLKANIWRMSQLRYLVTKAAIVLAIRGNGVADESEVHKNLQTLTRLAPRCCTEDMFARTPKISSLGIRGPLAAVVSADSLRKLNQLKKLKLINEPADQSDSTNQLHCLHPNCFPSNLRRLTLSGTYFKWECMSILGNIDRLEILKLKNIAFQEGSWKITENGIFRGLEFLLIGSTDLISWEVISDDCFPSLKCLLLKNCEKLEKIPLTLARTLDTLDVQNISESGVKEARQIQEEIVRRQGQQKDTSHD